MIKQQCYNHVTKQCLKINVSLAYQNGSTAILFMGLFLGLSLKSGRGGGGGGGGGRDFPLL